MYLNEICFKRKNRLIEIDIVYFLLVLPILWSICWNEGGTQIFTSFTYLFAGIFIPFVACWLFANRNMKLKANQ